jgi:hypothetical protein
MIILRCERIHLSAKSVLLKFETLCMMLKFEIPISFRLEFETLRVLAHFEAMEDH